MSGTQENPAEIAAELARLRKLEEGLRAERERIRAVAADEVAQLQAALRETAARAAQRDRDVERLTSQLEKASPSGAGRRRGGLRAGRPQLRRGEPDETGEPQRALATFERERQQLEERARAVAATEARQRATGAGLAAEAARLAALGESLGEQRRAAEIALLAAGTRPGEDERAADVPARPSRAGEEEARIAALLALRESELERRSADELERHRDRLEQELGRRRDEIETEVRAGLAQREQELAGREEAVARREIELSLVRRRIGDEERRLQERTWRAGGQVQRARPPSVVNRSRDLTFSEGWRRLADAQGRERADESG